MINEGSDTYYIDESEYSETIRGVACNECGSELVRVRGKAYCSWCLDFVPEGWPNDGS